MDTKRKLKDLQITSNKKAKKAKSDSGKGGSEYLFWFLMLKEEIFILQPKPPLIPLVVQSSFN